MSQKTIGKTITLEGVSLHGGKHSIVEIHPAIENNGINFFVNNVKIQAKYFNVHMTNLATSLQYNNTIIKLVEHLMAGIYGLGLTNLNIVVHGDEIPILDGSAKNFIQQFNIAGIVPQQAKNQVLYITKEVSIVENDKFIKIFPADHLTVDITIDFPHSLINKQRYIFDETVNNFINDIAPARTFGFIDDLQKLQSQGLALGASLDNCIGITQDGIINNGTFPDEFVRHKILDCLGDLYLGGIIKGYVEGYKTSHKLHHLLVKKIFHTNAYQYKTI